MWEKKDSWLSKVGCGDWRWAHRVVQGDHKIPIYRLTTCLKNKIIKKKDQILYHLCNCAHVYRHVFVLKIIGTHKNYDFWGQFSVSNTVRPLHALHNHKTSCWMAIWHQNQVSSLPSALTFTRSALCEAKWQHTHNLRVFSKKQNSVTQSEVISDRKLHWTFRR